MRTPSLALACILCMAMSAKGFSAEATVLDSIDLPAIAANGNPVSEISGLGWDADGQQLYAVSDNGYLHQFRVAVNKAKLSVELINSTVIADENVGLLRWSLTNAEGLHVRKDEGGKTELLIAFEDGPAIARFTPQAAYIADVQLPPLLADAGSYSSSNKRLESVTELQGIGIITAPEAHLIDEPENQHSIFAMDGRRWHFPALQEKQSAVKALDPLPGGRVLVLERTRDAAGDHANLRIVTLAGCAVDAQCPVQEVAVSDVAALAYDFEGATAMGAGLFLLATDSPKGGRMVMLKFQE